MQSEAVYQRFSDQLMRQETLTIRRGNGGLSYYKNGVFVCHFNAQPQKNRDDLGFADFRYDSLRPYLDIDATICAMQQNALPEVQIKRHKLWCSLHFPLSRMEHVSTLFLNHIISKVKSNPETNL